MQNAMFQADVDVDASATALAELSGGSVGEAMRLSLLGGLQIYAEIIGILGTLPQMDRVRTLRLAEAAAQRGAEEKLDLLFTLLEIALARLARTGATGKAPAVEAAPNEATILLRLARTPHQGRAWADVGHTALARARHGRAVNLDPAALVLDTIFKIQSAAAA